MSTASQEAKGHAATLSYVEELGSDGLDPEVRAGLEQAAWCDGIYTMCARNDVTTVPHSANTDYHSDSNEIPDLIYDSTFDESSSDVELHIANVVRDGHCDIAQDKAVTVLNAPQVTQIRCSVEDIFTKCKHGGTEESGQNEGKDMFIVSVDDTTKNPVGITDPTKIRPTTVFFNSTDDEVKPDHDFPCRFIRASFAATGNTSDPDVANNA
jgi:hypothetical protein